LAVALDVRAFQPDSDRTTDLRIETVARQQRVSTLAPLSRIRNPRDGAHVTGQEVLGSGLVGGEHETGGVARCRCVPSLIEQTIDDRAVDALLGEFLAQRSLTPGAGPIARLDPGSRERGIIEHPEFDHPFDRALDQIHSIPGAGQPPPDFHDRPGAWLEEPGGGLEDDDRVIDLCPALAPFGDRRAPASAAVLVGHFPLYPPVITPRRYPRPGSTRR